MASLPLWHHFGKTESTQVVGKGIAVWFLSKATHCRSSIQLTPSQSQKRLLRGSGQRDTKTRWLRTRTERTQLGSVCCVCCDTAWYLMCSDYMYHQHISKQSITESSMTTMDSTQASEVYTHFFSRFCSGKCYTIAIPLQKKLQVKREKQCD